MTQYAFIVDALRTPFGRYGGSLSSIRADDLGAVPLKALMALMARHPNLKWQAVIDVIYGCANQAGEDSRNVARTQRRQAEGVVIRCALDLSDQATQRGIPRRP